MSIKKLQKICHQIATEKGFWDCKIKFSQNKNQICNLGYACDACPYARNNGEIIALMHSELSEALEALRHNKWTDKGCVGEELADCFIRIMDFCEEKGIDLEKETLKKIKKNRKRPYKHGKQF